jgi:hypothetical protein
MVHTVRVFSFGGNVMETALLEKPTLRFVNSNEIRPIDVWENIYKNVWLFIEVTGGDAWDGYQGKLIATADDPIEFVKLGKDYRKRRVLNLTTRGEYQGIVVNVGPFIAAPEEHWT